jgi:hypothetical protein
MSETASIVTPIFSTRFLAVFLIKELEQIEHPKTSMPTFVRISSFGNIEKCGPEKKAFRDISIKTENWAIIVDY